MKLVKFKFKYSKIDKNSNKILFFIFVINSKKYGR